MSFADETQNEYEWNIQTADMNMLNAALAVIKWKKMFGYYVDRKQEFNGTYTISRNQLRAETLRMSAEVLQHEFVETIPSTPEQGKLYVSVRYRTAVHLCACGCGLKVVTPLRPSKWKMIFDGDSVSLAPSIGSWQFPCRSHYWVKNDRVEWAVPWSDEEIESGRQRDASDVRGYYASRGGKVALPQADVPIRNRRGGLIAALNGSLVADEPTRALSSNCLAGTRYAQGRPSRATAPELAGV